VEAEALKQLINLAESPLPVGYVSAMPDVHVGKGVTVLSPSEFL
jgi:RNA-splicing ligase RtcB